MLPASVTEVYCGTFNGCTSLTSITIPASLKKISYEAFRGSTALASITIPASVKEIGDHAFMDCKRLTSITIPASVELIGNNVFRSSGLKQLHMRACDPEDFRMHMNAFESIAKKCTLYVPAGSADAYLQHPIFGQFKKIVEDPAPVVEEAPAAPAPQEEPQPAKAAPAKKPRAKKADELSDGQMSLF